MKKRRVTSIVLASVIAASLAGCGNTSATTSAATSSAAADVAATSESSAVSESSAESASGTATTTASSGNQLVYGVTSTMAGDMGLKQWSSVGGDNAILYLINAYAPTCYDQNGKWQWDDQVAKSHEITPNDDGTETYTITLNDDLKFNDGTPITAKNYLSYFLLFSSPAAVAESAYGTAGQEFVGHDEYMTGEASTFKGLSLIDDHTFSITVSSDYNPYYYGLALMNFFPLAYDQWLPEGNWDVVDDGDGAYLKGDVEFNAANCGDAITAGRYLYTGRKCSGPYYLESLDAGSGQAVLRINDQYKGNFEGQKPSIETIIVRAVDTATMLDALQTGDVDLIDGIGDGATINAALDLADTGEYGADNYKYSGYMKLFFQCDWGPTQFENVRKAIAYLTDRDSLCQEATLGYGNVTNGQYSLAQWMAQDMEEELDEELEPYSFSPDKAVELLKEDGWVYNADGSDYVDGSGEIRYKKVTEDEAKYDDLCVTVDGQVYMPLELKYLGHAEGEGIETTLDELLDIYLVEADTTTKAGMKFDRTVMADSELLSYLNRRGANGEDKYTQPSYNAISLASGLGAAKFDKTYSWTFDEDKIANNKNRFFDHDLDDLSMKMVYGVEAGDDDSFEKIWFDYQKEFNAKLPELPLFNWTYCDVYNAKLKNFSETNIWAFQYAILYATIEE